jgi:hypothetical protein
VRKQTGLDDTLPGTALTRELVLAWLRDWRKIGKTSMTPPFVPSPCLHQVLHATAWEDK